MLGFGGADGKGTLVIFSASRGDQQWEVVWRCSEVAVATAGGEWSVGGAKGAEEEEAAVDGSCGGRRIRQRSCGGR
jgi:hypothetical protein